MSRKIKPIQPNLGTPASDNNYIDLSIINDNEQPYKNAIYNLNRTIEVLPKANDFYMSIEEMSIPSELLPCCILELQDPIAIDPNSNTPLTIYQILLSGNFYTLQAPTLYSDVWNTLPNYFENDRGAIVQYVYNLDQVITSLNLLLVSVLTPVIDYTNYPIYFAISEKGRIQLYIHPNLILGGTVTSFGMSLELYNLIGGNLPILEVDPNFNDVVQFDLQVLNLNIQTLQYYNGPPQNQLPRRFLLFEGPLNVYHQCDPIKRIIVEATALPINKQVDANDVQAKPDYVLTFQPDHVYTNTLDGNLVYKSIHPHNFIDLTTDTCLREIGFKIYWEDWNKELNLVRIPYKNCLTMRALCRKKICDKQDDKFM